MVCPVPRSGKLGFVGDYTGDVLTRYSRVKNWTFDALSDSEKRVYSGTRLGTQRIPGFIDYKGSFTGFGAKPPKFVGDIFTFIGYTAPTSGVPCTPGCAFTSLALIDSLSITWNWTRENRGVSWTIGFSSNEPSETITDFDDPCDDSVFCDPNPCDLTFVMKDACTDAVVEFCNIVSITLNFTATNIEYSNNSTGCIVKREVGNLDWTMEIVDQNPCIIPIINHDYWFEILSTVTPLEKWILKWGQYLGPTNLSVNMETGEIISKTNNFGMQAVNCCVPGTPVRGSITAPGGTIVWPYSTPS